MDHGGPGTPTAPLTAARPSVCGTTLVGSQGIEHRFVRPVPSFARLAAVIRTLVISRIMTQCVWHRIPSLHNSGKLPILYPARPKPRYLLTHFSKHL